MYTSITCIY